jgi:hypothetical protein
VSTGNDQDRPGRWWDGPKGTGLVVGLFVVVATLWSWPAARLDPHTLVTRHFDLYVTIWLVEQAVDGLPRLLATGSAWPAGESLARVDSYLLMLLGWAGRGLLSGWLLTTLLTWLGPALNAWAAEHCARRVLSVRRPWSLLAGLAYGFSGIAATAVLEGHVYFLLAAWLPLLLTTCWTAPKEGIPWGRGALVGLLWSLALLSSAYLGVLASLLLITILLARRPTWRLLPGAALVAVPVAVWYLWVFSISQQHATLEVKPELILTMGTATVANLSTWTAQLDELRHSVGAPLGFTTLWLLLLSPLLLRRERGWRAIAILALLSLALCFGRSFRVMDGGAGLPSPVALLVGLPGVEMFRFPIRFAWLFQLCGGLVAAAGLQALARRIRAGWLWPVLGLALIDGLLLTGLPLRSQQVIAEIPSAYASAPEGRPILDSYGRAMDGTSGELEMWTRNLGCYYQSQHGRPILELCVRTEVESPREQLDAALGAGLVGLGDDPDPDQLRPLRTLLEEQGVGAVALHADFYRPGDRARMIAGLERLLGPPLADSSDGGERVLLYAVATGGLAP